MLIRDRQEKILQLVNENTRLSFQELSEQVGVSESTLRRDLSALQERGLLSMVRGGAESSLAIMGRGEELIDRRYSLNSVEKEKIGRKAASLIKPNDLVFIDSGSTTEKMCEFITERKATYVTIGLKHSIILSHNGLNTIIAPGRIKLLTEGIQGGYTSDFLRNFNFTIAFFGALGISKRGGYSTTDPEDAIVKSTVIKRCLENYILSDASKFGLDTAASFGDLSDLSIITTRESPIKEYNSFTNVIIAS
ncbi:DeoR/GlpR family DNA-binding transcription regulator [Succinivibrio dextrinosolvens]|uniref:DeoR/GlpR family DNA-binding transcription regulator n=1 Tax=Succinivibrio dextrinosolvens TaxID=83771 RepID=UPI00241BF0BF|nr:DeoR/GlpR family DNA-binding transcription regulator [Succinivibrio dextrinosolvens]MBE6423663.1 DeoR/GlpR transcriptional regulator [Succinivibrio dextrinosolvens]